MQYSRSRSAGLSVVCSPLACCFGSGTSLRNRMARTCSLGWLVDPESTLPWEAPSSPVFDSDEIDRVTPSSADRVEVPRPTRIATAITTAITIDVIANLRGRLVLASLICLATRLEDPHNVVGVAAKRRSPRRLRPPRATAFRGRLIEASCPLPVAIWLDVRSCPQVSRSGTRNGFACLWVVTD
jgi:hypothetical protein